MATRRALSAFGLVAVCGALIGCSSRGPADARMAQGGDAGESGVPMLSGEGGVAGDVSGDAGAPAQLPGLDPTLNLPCNGRPDYCSKRYDELCQVATHDSVASDAESWAHPTQSLDLFTQLARSVRVLTLEVVRQGNTISVCRGDCSEGNLPLAAVLGTVRDFFAQNPREVLTLLIETEIDAETLAGEFARATLDQAVYTAVAGKPWPTFGELIDRGRPLIVFANAPGHGAAWLLPRDQYIWETAGDWTSVAAMSCGPAIGDGSQPLYLVHDELVAAPDGDNPGQPNTALAEKANAVSRLTTLLQGCASEVGHGPNFVSVDYFEIGDPMGACQSLNGLAQRP